MASSRAASNETRYSPRRCRGELIFALPMRFAGAVDRNFELSLAAGTQRRHDRLVSGDACCCRPRCQGCQIGNPFEEDTVSGHVYKKVELIGSSPNSVNEAIETAISRASKTMRNLDWFEVDQIRGQIVNGKVAHYQVVMKVGFRIDD
jgi:flavin-binding protein dodecin